MWGVVVGAEERREEGTRSVVFLAGLLSCVVLITYLYNGARKARAAGSQS